MEETLQSSSESVPARQPGSPKFMDDTPALESTGASWSKLPLPDAAQDVPSSPDNNAEEDEALFNKSNTSLGMFAGMPCPTLEMTIQYSVLK